MSPRRLSREAWGRGYATEAAKAALADGFIRCGFERVVATVQRPNLSSAGVAMKLGMSQLKEGPGGQESELLVFALAREEWARGAAARL